MGVEAAIIGGSVVSGAFGMKASSEQSKAAGQAAGLSMEQYQQTREDLAPWRAVGSAANYELGALAGLPVDYPGSPGGTPDGSESPLARPGGWQQNQLYGGDVIDTTAREVPNQLAQQGRNGDTEIAHVTPGEIVVPREVAQQPGVQNQLYQGFQREGMDPRRYRVGDRRNRLNPRTGRREYFAEDDLGGWREDDYGRGGNPRDLDQDRDRRRSPFGLPEQPAPAPQGTPLPEGYYDQGEAIDRFYESPEYTVPFEEGGKMIEASAAARGGLFSGNTGAELTRYGQDLASNRYNDYWNHLYGLSSSGANAAAQTGQAGMQAAGQAGNYLYGAGGNAPGYVNIGNSINAGIGNWLYYDQMRR